MTPDRWQKISQLYQAARARDGDDRAVFLAEACGGDEPLRREVESLLAQPASAQGFLEGEALSRAAQMVSDVSASVLTGRRLGAYQVQARLGAGGMGEVYRARDTKLGRDVAIKILPRAFTSDPERLVRFEREARMLAALNHPNIGAIYGLEDADGIRALVLELVDGETLADRVARRPIPLKDALPIARQIAHALDAAHDKGIVHRDLKPRNVALTVDGTVKVLDFGLAKVSAGDGAAADGSHAPTMTIDGTREGMVLGTAAYMSPEQARGQVVDKRTDIWAFGCVLYEMLTGRQAFARNTMTDTLAAIVEREPDWRALPAETPAHVQQLLTRCLTKDPKRRLRDIGDVALELEEPASGAVMHEETASTRWRMKTLWTSGAAGAVVVTALAGAYLRQTHAPLVQSPAANVTRLTATLDAPDWLGLDRPTLAWSHDGTRLVYVERNDAGVRFYLRPIDQFEGHPIAGTETANSPFFAPDGDRIGFFLGGKLRTISLGRGTPVDVCVVATTPLGAAWTSAGTIVLGSMNGSGLWQVPASGGTSQPVGGSQNAGGRAAEAWPEALPDGRSVLYTVMPSGGKPAFLAVASLATGARKVLIEGSAAHYVSTGHLVYMLGSSLMGVRFDTERVEVVGTPVRLLDDVQQVQGAGAAQFAVSNSGNLVYVSPVGRSSPRNLVLVDRRGHAEQIAPPARGYENPRVSPDGQRIVVDVQGPNGRDVWTYDRSRVTWSQLTFNGRSAVPIWTPDGKRVTFAATTDGGSKLYWKVADGSGADELLSAEAGNPHSWAPDGRLLARTGGNPEGGGGSQIMLLSMDGGRETRPLLSKREGTEMAAPTISPDGHWLAYVANDSGRRQVYVRPFPGGEGRWLVSGEGGTQPMWSRDGRELFYRNGDRLMAVGVSTTPVFKPETPRLLFEGHYEGAAVRANYDVMADGQHFVMVKAAEQELTNRRLNIVLNWGEELKRRVPGSEK